MNMAELVRFAVAGDIDRLGAIAEASNLFPAAIADELIAPYLARRGEEFWLVAARSEALLGFVYCAPERMTVGTWNMLALAVDPEHQGQGLGAALVASVEAEVRRRGGRILLVETQGTPDFEPAYRFYRSQGFSEEARIRDFYDAGLDKIVFWKALGAAGV